VVSLLLIGLCCGILSQVGDLFASFIKRWADVKDFSSLFPGHGGVMDRLDSILFCAPFVLLCFTILTKIGIY
jgi:phosphatidate cytidylyltransferase